MSKTTDSISSTCVLCCQAIKIYAVGPCDHHVCFRCSTKMRVLCEQKYCAVCRTDMSKVIFTHKLHPYQGIISHKFPADRKHGIAFATSKVQEEFRRLQDHRCPICSVRRLPENTFKDLQDHLRKEHEMFFCELCLEHLQVFTHERKCYNRKNLAMHKRKGDPDDTSYRGHPLCEFCDERYFDADELLKHLRRQHYFCHFCETDGASNQYYNDYEDLKYHFREEHFLCEEDGCGAEKFTHAFRSEIDLKAHKATAHAKNMTRAQARQARQLDIEINLPPRPRDNRGIGGAGRGRGRRFDRYEGNDTARAVEASIDSARREEQVREEESIRNDKKVKKPQKGKEQKVSNSTEGRKNSKQDDNGSGKVSPVSSDNKEGASNKTSKTTKTSKDDNKENQRKGKEVSINQSVESKHEEAATNLVTGKKDTNKRKGKDKSSLQDFPSLATFKPLVDETVTPSWDEDKSLANVVTALSKEGNKKKKKKKKDSSEKDVSEEPKSGVDLYSGVTNVSGKKPAVIEQQNQPLWVINSGKSSASSTSHPSGVPSTRPAQQSNTWATNVSLTNQSQPAKSTWASSMSAGNKSAPPTAGKWADKSSTPNLGNSGDFPTLSSIASLLGGSTTSKKTTKDNGNSHKSKKQSDGENKLAKASNKSWNKIAETERSSPSEVVNKKKAVEQVQIKSSAISSGPRPPPGLTSAPTNNVANRAPPGFGQAPKMHNPPPGFAVSFPLTSPSPDPPLDAYVLPTNYTERNFALLEKIKAYLDYDDSKLMIFKTMSGEFRRNTITPAEYYRHCRDLLGDHLPKIFSELVSLLPDVIKQQELLSASNDYKLQEKPKKEERVLKISEGKSISKGSGKSGSKVWGNSAEHSTCTQCGQILLKADMEGHLNSHQDFPSLSASVGSKSKSFMAPSPWAKIK